MIDYLLFDLDNTLYPRNSGLGDEINRRMSIFVSEFLEVSVDEAVALRSANLHAHGTTLKWLVSQHNLTDIEPFLLAVHPQDLGRWITPDMIHDTQATLDAVDLPASILTNAPREHAERVLHHLGVADRFEQMVDIRENGFSGKPAPQAYQRAVAKAGARIEHTLFIDDVLQYLLPFRDLGGEVVHITTDTSAGSEIGESSIPSIERLSDLPAILKTAEMSR